MHVIPEDADDRENRRRRDVPPGSPAAPDDEGDRGTTGDLDGEDFSNLLTNFEDAQDLDDQNADDVDPGVEIGESADLGDEEDMTPIELDEVIDATSEAGSLMVGGDDLGPEGDVGSADAIEPLPTAADDEGDGVGDEDLAPQELERLDTEAEEDEEPPNIVPSDLGVALEDDPLGPPVLAWVDVAVPHGPGRSLVAALRGRVFAAGATVAALDDSGVAMLLTEIAEHAAASLLPMLDGSLFFTTSRGELFRWDSRGPGRVDAWKDALGVQGSVFALEIGGPTPSSRPALLLRVGGEEKALLESTDQGSTFRRVDLGGSILSLSRGAPPFCVVRADRGVRVVRFEPTGGFSTVAPDWQSDSEAQALAVSGDVVGALEPDRGLQVSADGGRSFRVVRGFQAASAIAAGRVGGRPVIFAALFDAELEATKIVSVDATSSEAFVIAGIDSSDDDSTAHARVLSLAWDDHTETLWGAGAFGLKCWRRPTSA